MATCSLSALQSDACANGFEKLSRGDKLIIAVQLAYNRASSTQTVAQIQADACSNGFDKLSFGDKIAMALQLACNISGGT